MASVLSENIEQTFSAEELIDFYGKLYESYYKKGKERQGGGFRFPNPFRRVEEGGFNQATWYVDGSLLTKIMKKQVKSNALTNFQKKNKETRGIIMEPKSNIQITDGPIHNALRLLKKRQKELKNVLNNDNEEYLFTSSFESDDTSSTISYDTEEYGEDITSTADWDKSQSIWLEIILEHFPFILNKYDSHDWITKVWNQTPYDIQKIIKLNDENLPPSIDKTPENMQLLMGPHTDNFDNPVTGVGIDLTNIWTPYRYIITNDKIFILEPNYDIKENNRFSADTYDKLVKVMNIKLGEIVNYNGVVINNTAEHMHLYARIDGNNLVTFSKMMIVDPYIKFTDEDLETLRNKQRQIRKQENVERQQEIINNIGMVPTRPARKNNNNKRPNTNISFHIKNKLSLKF
jgi:hypothetical protein